MWSSKTLKQRKDYDLNCSSTRQLEQIRVSDTWVFVLDRLDKLQSINQTCKRSSQICKLLPPSSIRNVDSKDEIKNQHWLHDSTQVEILSFHQLRLAGATPQYSCHTYQNHATQDGPEQVEIIRI